MEEAIETFSSKNKMGDKRKVHTTLKILLVAGLFLFSLTLNISRAVRADYNHDEDQFITSARLLLDEGLLPYRDYPYFHTPYLIFIYALLFKLTGTYNLLAARLFSAISASTSVMMVFWMALYFFKSHPVITRYVAAFGIAFIYLPNPLLAATAGFSWNHNLAVLCMLGSLWLFMLAPHKKTPWVWFLISGVLVGIAAGIRISSLTILPAYLLALAYLPAEFSWKRSLNQGLIFLAGLCLALLPLLGIFLTAPQQFVFGNFEYAQLNSTYRLDVPVQYDVNLPVFGTRSLADKFEYLWNEVISQPINLLLFTSLVFFGWSVLTLHVKRKEEQSFRNILVLAAVPFVAIASFLPTPTWYQYFYAPLPFALLAITLGLSYLISDSSRVSKWFLVLLVELAIFSCFIAILDFKRMSFLRYVDLWKPLVIHQVGMDIREQVGPDGRVFTTAPLYPLEAGLQVYPPMATGVFAFRTGSLLSEEEHQRQGIVSRENLESYLNSDLPDGILVGFDQRLEEPIVQYAVSKGYTSVPLDRGLMLWVRPGIKQP